MKSFVYQVLDRLLMPCFLFACFCCITLAAGAMETMNNRMNSALLFETELDPVYLRWVISPGELRGFWFAHPCEETKERTGANTFSSHISLHLLEDPESPDGFRIESPFVPSHSTVEMGFHSGRPMAEVRILISTAFEGAAGKAELYRIEEDQKRIFAGSSEQVNARKDSWVIVKPEGHNQNFPAGQYVLKVASRRMRVEVWPGPSASPETWIGFPDESEKPHQQQTALLATVSYVDGTASQLRKDEEQRPWLSLGSHDPGSEAEEARMFFNIDLGEHNNPFFIYYPPSFQAAFPNAFMQDIDGNRIKIDSNPIGEVENPVPAVDDPDLRRLSKKLIKQGVESLRGSPWLRYYVIAGEECYPDYFGMLPVGDFRKAFTDRFNLYSHQEKWGLAFDREAFRADPDGPLGKAWYLFREHAMADRAADYMHTFLENDSEHPVFYPTHGNPFFGLGQSGRKQLGYSPGLIAGACDGFETGQISIDTDVEFLNLLTLSHNTSWGVPVVSPRLGNKTLDPSARGGGRSFTPTMLRRLFYEAIGHGVWHTGLLQWTGVLGDGEWFIRDTPAEQEALQVFKEVESASPYLTGMSRLQPGVGLYISDSTWVHKGWQARWTGFYQDALWDHWQIALVGDQLLGEELASKIPVLVSLDNTLIDSRAIQRLKEYQKAGGCLIRWGEFGQADELGTPFEGDPFKDAHGVVDVQSPPDESQRELMNACTTGLGAHKHVTRYQAAPFVAIKEAILSRVPESYLCPVKIEAAGRIHAYTLTDGWNLVTVLVNHESQSTDVSLKPSGGSPRSWHWKQIGVPSEASGKPKPGTATLTLKGAGSALIWMTPGAVPADIGKQLKLSREILDRWVEWGVDVETYRACLSEADTARSAGLDAKAHALSARIVNGLGINASLVENASGVSKIRASVFNSSGKPVSGASVICRLVPGKFHWLSLEEPAPGIYEGEITKENLPDLYNPGKGCYEPYSGPLRLIVHSSQGGQDGFCLRTLSLEKRIP